MGDVNLEIKLSNLDERVIKIEESGGSGGDGYITSVSNDFNVVNKKLSLSNDVTTKLSKLNSDGTIDFSNVKNNPTTLNGYGITDAYTKTEVDGKLDSWHKYNGSIEEQIANNTNTDEDIYFTNVDTSKAYELWFDTSDGQQASVKSSELLLQSDGTYKLHYVVNTPTAQTKFRLLVKGIN